MRGLTANGVAFAVLHSVDPFALNRLCKTLSGLEDGVSDLHIVLDCD